MQWSYALVHPPPFFTLHLQEINDPRSAWSHCSIDSLELFFVLFLDLKRRKMTNWNTVVIIGGCGFSNICRVQCGFSKLKKLGANEENKSKMIIIRKVNKKNFWQLDWEILTKTSILIGPKKRSAAAVDLKKGICSCIWTALGIWNVEHNNDIGSYIL